MKVLSINLGLKEDTINKKFSFSIDKEYEEKVIGKDKTGGVDVPLKSSTTKTTATTNSDVSCGKNEELGADGQTCVCAHGYEKTNGVCTKQKVECDYNKELGADGVTCVCKSDYLKSDNTCSSTKVTTSQTTTDTTTNNNDDDDSNNSSTTDNNSSSTNNNTTTDTTIDPDE